MKTEVYSNRWKLWTWVDLENPTESELNEVVGKFGIPLGAVRDCLEPEHLPKFERLGNLGFLILRGFDHQSSVRADTVQNLTRKTAVFWSDQEASRFLVTVHRTPQNHHAKLMELWRNQSPNQDLLPSEIVSQILLETADSYDHTIEQSLNTLAEMEMSVFEVPQAKPFKLKKAYYLKRRASVIKRMLMMMKDLIPKVQGLNQETAPVFQAAKEECEAELFYADELIDTVHALLNLHLSIASQKTNEASHRTNEVVRFLTIISVFMLPLNLVTGFYGMNFENLPGLKHPFGVGIAIVAMLLMFGIIYFLFKKRGWIK